jgi:tetratricopeptide (TPR) repeat protein
VTSRERLNLYGEVTYAIGGLALPEKGSTNEVPKSEAVALFVQRATAVLPNLLLCADDVQQVGHICKLVEGMPLAIELAATWVDTLSLSEIVDEIEYSLDILQTERRDAPHSHNSIRAAFLRSWNLLDDQQQITFRRLAVFRGGFSREAVRRISEVNLQTLRALVSKSLLRHDPDRGRYELHELLRYFAQEKLEVSGEAEMIYDSHATYFAQFVDEHWQQTKGFQQHEALLRIEADIENVRAAWSYRVSEGNIAELKRFFHGLWVIYDVRGWHPAGVTLFEQGVEVIRNASTVEARASLGWLLAVQGMFIIAGEKSSRIGFDLARRGVQILRDLGQLENMVVPFISLFVTARQVGETDVSVQAANDCLDFATKTGDQWGIVKAKQLLALRAIEEENYDSANTLAAEALSICEARGDRWSESAICIEVMGTTAILLQQYDTAREWLFRGLRSAEAIDFKYAMQMAYFQLGYIALLLNDYAEAAQYWHKALEVGDRMMGGFAIVGFFGTATTGDYKL